MAKDYYGKCGSCKYCELGTGVTWCYVTEFLCSRSSGRRVKADEKACSAFQPAPGRTNSDIEKYDRH